MYKVSEVSTLTGISVRMLHHYDKIGLLVPQRTTNSKYRLYTSYDIEKLYQILLLKELDFELKEIKNILDNKDFDKLQALKVHRKIILERKQRLENILNSIDDTIDDLNGGIKLNKNNFEAFNYEEIEKHKEKYKEETKTKYGNSDAYKQSEEKTAKYSKDDWTRITD